MDNTSFTAGFVVGLWMSAVKYGMAGNGKIALPEGAEYNEEDFKAGIAAGCGVKWIAPDEEGDHGGQQET